MAPPSLFVVLLVGVVACVPFELPEVEVCKDTSGSSQVQHVNLWDTYKAKNGNTNFLFRGGNPDSTHSDGSYYFNYEKLVSTMQTVAKDDGYIFPSTFYMIDISFLNDYSSDGDLKNNAEFKFFQQNPDKGEYVFWETHGESDDPLMVNLTSELQGFMADTYGDWGRIPTEWRMNQMRSYLTQEGNIPIVIYGHCDCGCDRTGEMFGSYALRYLSHDWEWVSKTDQQIPGRNISCTEYRGMMWYCFHLSRLWQTDLGCGTTYQVNCNAPIYTAIAQEAIEEKVEEVKAPQSTTVHYTYYVDSNVVGNGNENFLFRGGDPDRLSGYKFNYDGVVSAMQSAAKDAGKTLPSSFYLIDITTIGIHSSHDVTRNNNEEAYWNPANNPPHPGEFVFWHVYGEDDDPKNPRRDAARNTSMITKFKSWSHNLLSERNAQLKTWLQTEKTLPTVIFAHDSTGYHEISNLMAAYYMEELKWSWKDVNTFNYNIHGSYPSCHFYFSYMWYCWYLQAQGGSYASLDCSYDFQPSCHSS